MGHKPQGVLCGCRGLNLWWLDGDLENNYSKGTPQLLCLLPREGPVSALKGHLMVKLRKGFRYLNKKMDFAVQWCLEGGI